MKNKLLKIALMIAAMEDNLESLRLLLDAGADINAQNAEGATALGFAVYQDRLENLRLLLQAGAKDFNGCALEEAESKGHHEAAQLLREALAR